MVSDGEVLDDDMTCSDERVSIARIGSSWNSPNCVEVRRSRGVSRATSTAGSRPACHYLVAAVCLGLIEGVVGLADQDSGTQ